MASMRIDSVELRCISQNLISLLQLVNIDLFEITFVSSPTREKRGEIKR